MIFPTESLRTARTGPPARQRGARARSRGSWARCHSNVPLATAMRDVEGRKVAPFDLWQGTLMAARGAARRS